ncbi:hypothetical protein T439DRAFT_377331 [Meredithblackwellia eburnea MCA 4105]
MLLVVRRALPLLQVGLLSVFSSVAAISSADIESVFGPTGSLTGSSTSLPVFTLSIFANESHALVSMNATATPPDGIGWMAVGVGSAMSNADILVAWPTFAGGNLSLPTSPAPTWILSHRQADGHVQPRPPSSDPTLSTSKYFTLVPSLTTLDPRSPFTVVSFTRPLTMPSDYPGTGTAKELKKDSTPFIYASSSVRPANASEDSPIGKHDQAHASMMMDLSKTASLVVVPGSSGPNGRPAWSSESWPDTRGEIISTRPLTRRDMMLAAHAAIASTALLFFSPLAILIARYLRHLPWFRIHASIQISAYLLILTAFALAVCNVNGEHFANNHAILGLIIFLALSCQLGIGWTAHKTPTYKMNSKKFGPDEVPTVFESVKGKPWIRLAHIALGLTITILGWAQIRLGLEEWVEYSDSGRQVPLPVLIIFWALVGVESAEVFLGRFLKEEIQHNSRSRASSLRGISRFSSRVFGRSSASVAMGRDGTNGSALTRVVAAMDVWGIGKAMATRRGSDDSTVVGDEEPKDKAERRIPQDRLQLSVPADTDVEAEMRRAATV